MTHHDTGNPPPPKLHATPKTKSSLPKLHADAEDTVLPAKRQKRDDNDEWH